MSLCPHGKNHERHCYQCEEIAEAELKAVNKTFAGKKMKTEELDLFAIDKNRLDEEWVNHARIYGDHARKLADAKENTARTKAKKDVLKAELEKVYAETDLRIRKKDPQEFGLDKWREDAIKGLVLGAEEYQEAQQAVFDCTQEIITAEHEEDLLLAAVNTLGYQKKPGLENIVQLLTIGYCDFPKKPQSATREQITEMERRVIRNKEQRKKQ